MKVREAMTPHVVTVRETTSFHEVLETMLLHQIGALPVVDAKGSLRGIVTEADLLPKEAYRGRPHPRTISLLHPGADDVYWREKATGLTAADVMTYPVVTVAPGDSLRAATRRMVEHQLKRLVVVDDGRVVGMLARRDVLAAADRTDAEIELDVELALRRCLFVQPEHDVEVSVDDGIVTLAGDVPTARDRHIAETLAAKCEGVVAVINELRPRARASA